METAQSFEDSENSDDSSEQDANTADCDEIIQRVFGSYDNLAGTDTRTKEALVQSIGSLNYLCSYLLKYLLIQILNGYFF